MKGFVSDIEEVTEDNSDFRRVLYTAHQMQLVLMALRPGEEIGEETHKDRTQFFRVEKGRGEVWIDGTRSKIKSDTAIVVPAGARHTAGEPATDAVRARATAEGSRLATAALRLHAARATV